jgi:hypothetical protein
VFLVAGAAVTREREAGTLALVLCQGAAPGATLWGKLAATVLMGTVRTASMALSGVDLAHVLDFERQAEELRYRIVQRLNDLHTMARFFERYPEWRGAPVPNDTYSNAWYYAMQQRGDDAAARAVAAYFHALERRRAFASRASFLFPPAVFRRALDEVARTDLDSHLPGLGGRLPRRVEAVLPARDLLRPAEGHGGLGHRPVPPLPTSARRAWARRSPPCAPRRRCWWA